jgi:hypothetical protein
VAVERSGQLGSQLGLKRENSGEPSMAKRRTSFSIDEEEHPNTTAERKQSIATELDARKNSTVIEETIPEVAVETPSKEADKQLGGDTKGTKTTGGATGLKKAAASNASSNGNTNGSNKSITTGKTVDKPASSKFTARPAPISTAKSSAASKPSPKTTKSPAAPKTPTTPRGRPSEPAKPPEKKPEKKEVKPAATSSSTSKPASRPTTSSAYGTAAKTRIPPSPPQSGFVKPKPRSPTRPIKLPASLTAHTASSGSKTATAPPQTTAGRRSLSRASGNSQPTNPLPTHPTLSRSPSRASTATAPKSMLNRKPSTLNKTHSRPSLGPPPSQLKKQPSRQSLPQSTPADEGFLARMMRPTTSSASKTAEKVTTPPKRAPSVKRPVTRDGPPKNEAPKAAAPKMGKLVAKPTAKETKGVASSSAATKAKEEPKQSAAMAEEKPGIPVAPKTPETHTRAMDVGEDMTRAAEAHKVDVEDAKITEAQIDTPAEAKHVDEPMLPAVLEKVSDVESTPDKPAPIEELVPVAVVPAKEEEAVVEESVVPDTKEDAPKKTEDVEAVKEAIDMAKSEPEHVLEKAVEVEIPKEIEAAEDPEDAKAREEIAKLNAEVMKASLDEDVE